MPLQNQGQSKHNFDLVCLQFTSLHCQHTSLPSLSFKLLQHKHILVQNVLWFGPDLKMSQNLPLYSCSLFYFRIIFFGGVLEVLWLPLQTVYCIAAVLSWCNSGTRCWLPHTLSFGPDKALLQDIPPEMCLSDISWEAGAWPNVLPPKWFLFQDRSATGFVGWNYFIYFLCQILRKKNHFLPSPVSLSNIILDQYLIQYYSRFALHILYPALGLTT